MTVLETPFFLGKAATLLDGEERSELVAFLGMNPEALTRAERNDCKKLIPLLVKTYARGRPV
jgi:hypothetical protein